MKTSFDSNKVECMINRDWMELFCKICTCVHILMAFRTICLSSLCVSRGVFDCVQRFKLHNNNEISYGDMWVPR